MALRAPLIVRIVVGDAAMTEKQWLNARDVGTMLVHLYRNAIVSDRKLRLFACACCRRLWRLLDERARRVVEGVEHYADGLLNERDLALWVTECNIAAESPFPPPGGPAVAAVWGAARTVAVYATASKTPAQSAAAFAATRAALARRGEKKAQRDLLRDLFGNPFRPVHVQPAWRAWNGGTLVRVARAIYDERRYGDLPVLADALEEAGCTDTAILAHCRCGGEHARGCWVIDQLLGKE
jgi:hypothetical protein